VGIMARSTVNVSESVWGKRKKAVCCVFDDSEGEVGR